MIRTASTRTGTGVACLLLALCAPSIAGAAPAADKPPGLDKQTIRGIKRAFARMKIGVRQENELYFKSGWLPIGYEQNLVAGRAGMTGRAFYRQLKSRRWIPRPKLEKTRTLTGKKGKAYLLPCLIWSPTGRKAIATLWGLVIYSKKWRRWQMLGGGGHRADVQALGERYLAGEPLAPPGRGRGR